MTIQKENIGDIVNLFLNFFKLIPSPVQLNYKHLKSLLIPIVDEKEFNVIVKAALSIKDRLIFRNIDFINSVALSVKTLSLAKKINTFLTADQKTVFITILARAIQENNQSENNQLIQSFYNIGQMFELNKELSNSILDLHLKEPETFLRDQDSILITNSYSDYISVINGHKVLYKPELDFRLLVKNVKTVKTEDTLIFKILEFNDRDNIFKLKENDVLPFNNSIRLLLNANKITYEELKFIINQMPEELPKIEIQETDLTPAVILDSQNNLIKIEGQSIHSQPQKFYEPVLFWIQSQKKKRPKNFQIHIKLRFFNTYTSKILLEILFQLKRFDLIGCNVDFYWYYENDDFEIKEAGENYSIIIEKTFHYISYDPQNINV